MEGEQDRVPGKEIELELTYRETLPALHRKGCPSPQVPSRKGFVQCVTHSLNSTVRISQELLRNP